MTTRYGYNVLRLDNQHRERLWKHCANLPPGCMLFYNHQGDLAWEFKRSFPEWIVIHRVHPDHEDFLRDTPSAWYRTHANRGRDGVIIHTVNETAFSDAMLDWHTELIKLARPDGNRLVCINSAVGIPEPDEWKRPAARRFLEEMAKDGDRHYVGLHEYWPYNPTAFFRGTTQQDPVIQDRNQWPRTLTDAFPGWLCGRYHFLHLTCDEMGIPRPKVLLTEVGVAQIGAVNNWQKALPRTPDFDDGWKSAREVWRQWYPDLTHEQAYAMQTLYLLKHIWTDCVAVITFGEGDSGGWDAFTVGDALQFKTEMEIGLRVSVPPLPPPTYPVVPPLTDTNWQTVIMNAVSSSANVRQNPSTDTAIVATVGKIQQVKIIESETYTDNASYHWLCIRTGANYAIGGWIRNDVVTYIPPPPLLTTIQLTDSEVAALRSIVDKLP